MPYLLCTACVLCAICQHYLRQLLGKNTSSLRNDALHNTLSSWPQHHALCSKTSKAWHARKTLHVHDELVFPVQSSPCNDQQSWLYYSSIALIHETWKGCNMSSCYTYPYLALQIQTERNQQCRLLNMNGPLHGSTFPISQKQSDLWPYVFEIFKRTFLFQGCSFIFLTAKSFAGPAVSTFLSWPWYHFNIGLPILLSPSLYPNDTIVADWFVMRLFLVDLLWNLWGILFPSNSCRSWWW